MNKKPYESPKHTGDYVTDLLEVVWSQKGYEENEHGSIKYSDWAGQADALPLHFPEKQNFAKTCEKPRKNFKKVLAIFFHICYSLKAVA